LSRPKKVYTNPERTCILPEFPHSQFEGYAVNYLQRNFWKVQKTYGEWEDAMSIAKWCYYDTRQRYGSRIKTPQHFMTLYKRCLQTWVVEDAGWATRTTKTEDTYMNSVPETTAPEATLSVILREASKELRDVLSIILRAPKEVLDLLKKDAKAGVDCFFSNAVNYCGISEEKAPELEAELRGLLQ